MKAMSADGYNTRRLVVLLSWATGHPIKKAARIAGVERNTARRWVREYMLDYGIEA